jgi:hypothetical protein
MWAGCRKSEGKIDLEWRGQYRRVGLCRQRESEGAEGGCGSVSGRPCLARGEGRQRGKIKPFSFYDVIYHDVFYKDPRTAWSMLAAT